MDDDVWLSNQAGYIADAMLAEGLIALHSWDRTEHEVFLTLSEHAPIPEEWKHWPMDKWIDWYFETTNTAGEPDEPYTRPRH